ncbi:T6SS effector BTH_I2691 family protein [Pseudomonas shirazensis]|uniref:T6SS effector BTH_I2691 family protein n=1 Tax=Pseudomonas shirazensis TaxID=2745494 RepID=UPI001645A1E9|nr:T6SS effector BTH_I2691 family protein [Pseudomonas shirazensis]MBV4499303.1 hypothetical protein [Pseudomonas shirazensis]
MNSLVETLALCQRINSGYKPALSNSPVANCTRRFELLPLRYAAIGGNPAQRALLPQLPGHLSPFQDVGELQHSTYAIRPLREGFFYLLFKRRSASAHEWHSQYRVAANGSLQYISADAPWAAPMASNLEEMIRSFGWTITLHDLDDIEELRPLYSPSPLTPRMLDNYRLLETEYRNNLPAIDIAQLIQPAEAPHQAHVIKHDQLDWVVDFKAAGQPELQALLDLQPFNYNQIVSRHASHQALAPAVNQVKPRGAAIVIADAIGITQELNAWRNAAVDEVKSNWLQRTVEPGVDNERRLLVAQSFLEVAKLYPQMMAENIVQTKLMAKEAHLSSMALVEHHTSANPVSPEEHHQRMEPQMRRYEQELRAEVQGRLDNGEFENKFNEKYGPLVDGKAMRSQVQRFEEVMQHAQQIAEERSLDHCLWVQDDRLLQALDSYDTQDLISGLAFAEQTGQCVIGMELSDLGSRVLDRCWHGRWLHPSNLIMRALCYNQDDIREELAALLEAAKAAPATQSSLEVPEAVTKQALAAASAFDRVNTLYEQLQSQSAAASIGLYAWFVLLGRQVLRTAAPNSVDRALHHGLRLTLFASVHQTAVEVRLGDAARSGHAVNPQRSGGQVARYLDQAWAEGLVQANRSDFYKVRASAVICLLEGMLMANKAQQLPDSSTRVKAEMLAMAMTTAAAGFEIGASYVDQVLAKYGGSSVTGRGAAVTLGRLKLWGASLAGMGGLMISWWDFVDMRTHHQEALGASSTEIEARARILVTAYATRGAATVTLSFAELGTAIAIARPLFDYLSRNSTSKFVRYLASGMSGLASKLGSQATRLFLVRMILGGFWIGFFVTVIIIIFDDDALEKWCKRSIYRKISTSLTVYDETKELTELFEALQGVV